MLGINGFERVNRYRSTLPKGMGRLRKLTAKGISKSPEDRIVVMLSKLGGRGYSVQEAPGTYSTTDPDFDPDFENDESQK